MRAICWTASWCLAIFLLALFTHGCYRSHEQTTRDAMCTETGDHGCTIDHPCWCWFEADAAHCATCMENCLGPDCGCFHDGVRVDDDRCM